MLVGIKIIYVLMYICVYVLMHIAYYYQMYIYIYIYICICIHVHIHNILIYVCKPLRHVAQTCFGVIISSTLIDETHI
jgi:hypothetical protein